MQRFLSLVSIENMKMWKRVSTKIMPLILLAIVVGFCGLFKYIDVTYPGGLDNGRSFNQKAVTANADWKETLKMNITVAQSELKKDEGSGASKTDKLNIGGLRKTIAENQYRLDHNLDPSKDTGKNQSIWARMINMSSDVNPNFGGIIALFLIIACSAAVAGEFSEGTIKMMISRPYRRWEILTAKLITVLGYGFVLLIETLLAVFIALGLFFGFNRMDSNELLWTGSKIVYIPGFSKMLIVYGLDFLTAVVYVIFALMLAVLTRSRAMATGFSLFLLLVGGSLLQLLSIFFGWGKYILFTVTNFSAFLLRGSAFVGTSLGFALLLSLLYTAAFLFFSYFAFAKEDI